MSGGTASPGPGGSLVLQADESPADVHARLAGWGPLDAVEDRSVDGEGAARRFAASFLHLRPGGVYRAPATAVVEDLLTALEGVWSADGRKGPGTPLAQTVGEVRRTAQGVELVRTRPRTLATLREDEADLALVTDPSRGRVLTTVPAAVLHSRCVVSDPAGGPSRRVRRGRADLDSPATYDAPALRLREYDDVVCRPKQLVVQRGLVPPDTFRHHQARRLNHMNLKPAGAGFVWAPRGSAEERLPGAWFHLDNEHRGFFGHALTEQLARVWALPAAREAHPDLRVLVSVNRGRRVAEWEQVLLEGAGVRRDEVRVIEGPVRVERLLAATPMFSMPTYVHPAIADTWDQVGRSLRRNASDQSWPERIFCSRRHGKRSCSNRAEVEEFFVRRGFQIVFPEDWPVPDQVEMFNRAEVIAGFAGSGLFTSLFCEQPKHLVVITPDTYRPTNEYMIAAVRGHRLDRVEGRTLAVLPPGVRPDRPLQWPFAVDLEAQGPWLSEILGRSSALRSRPRS